MRRKLLVHSFIMAALLLAGLSVSAGVFPVTNSNNTGAGSLRQAILNANAAGPGPHTINFSVSGTIVVTSSLPAITVPGVTIDGGGTVTISGPAASDNLTYLILLSTGANNATIRGLTLQNTGYQPVTINAALSGVTLENLWLRQTGVDYANHGIYVAAASTNLTIRNVTITDIQKGTWWGIRFRSTVTGLNIDGLRIRNSGTNHLGVGNNIRGIQFEGVVTNSTIKNSTIDLDAPGVTDDGDYGIYCNTTVNGLTLDSVQISDAEYYNLTFAGAAANINLNRCVFDNLDGYGTNQLVRFNTNATNITIDSCVFDSDQRNTTDDGNNALWFNGNMQTINITKSTFNESDADGIYAFAGLNNDNITISGNTFTKIGFGGAHAGIHFTHVRNTTSDNGPVLFSDNIFRDINGVGIYVRPNNTTSYVIPNFTIRNNTITNCKVYGGIKVNYVDKIVITQNSIYNNVGNGIDLTDGSTANCGYEGANKPQLLSSAETSPGSGTYNVQVRMPALCGTNACSLELFSSQAGVKGIGGQHYVQTFTGLGSGVRTLSGVTGAFPEITGAPYGTWTATLRGAVNCGTSEFSNKISIKVNGPAGVDLGIKLWLRGDEIFAGGAEPTADGQLISGWEEFSGGGGPSSTTIVNNPVVRLGGINFNPIADMDGDVIRGHLPNAVSWLTTNTATTVAVMNPLSITASGDRFFVLFSQSGWDYNTNKAQIEFYRNGNNTHSYRGSTLLAPPIPGTTGVSSFNRPGVFTSVTTATNHSALYNGQSMGSGNYNKGDFAVSQWFIGGGYGPNANGAGAWQWASEVDFAEVFTYNRTLTPLELQKVQSYMALKYGIAMKQNYILSSGTQVWDVAANATYSKEIAALVRDNLSVLHQKQAKAFHTDEPVTIALGSVVAATNKDIEDSVTNNLSVFMWGNDSASTVTSQTFSGGFSNTRMPRVWKVQKTNWADADITVKLKGGKDNNYLLISTDPTFATFQQELKLKKDGSITLSTSLFPDGVYFTFGRQQRAPGGVSPDLDVWVKADEGVTMTGTNATAVQDQSASQRNWPKVSTRVLPWNSNAINYNPGIMFGDSAYFALPQFTQTYTQGEVFSVQSSATNVAGYPFQLGGNGGGVLSHYRYSDNNQYTHWGTNSRRNFSFGTKNMALPAILNLNTAANSWIASLDGRVYSTAAYTTHFPQYVNGSNAIGVGYGSYFRGPVTEVIQYKRKLNATERLQVNSYLALKYGITIDQTAATNYLASNGTTTMWNAADNGVYKNNIAGIGRDENGALYQKQSRSINTTASGNIIAAAVGDELALNNDANADSITNDRSFLVWADNAGAITYTTAVTGTNVTLRMPRVWKVDKTNWADKNITLKHFGSVTNTYLLISNSDETFATIDQEIALSTDSTVTINTSLLPDGAFFTFAKEIRGPGYVNNGVRFWLRADDAKSVPSDWYDYSGNDNNAAQPTVANQPVAVASSVNFNPAFDLDGTNDYMDFATNGGISGAASQFTMVSVTKRGTVGTADIILGQNTDATNGLGYYIAATNRFSITATNVTSVFGTKVFPTPNTPVLNSVMRGPTANLFTFNTNGAADGTGSANFPFLTNNLRLGVRGGTTTDHFGGDINEVVLYNRPLTAPELLKVNSYLALKYGITLNNGTTDYIATDDTTKMWTVSKNTGYTRNITGIGRDNKTGLFQKQSRSVHDSTLTIALGTAVAADNASNTGDMDDMSFFTFADNGLDTSFSVATTTGNGTVRMARVWKVDRTNWGDQDITFKVQPGGERYLLVHTSDPTFGAGTQEFMIDIPTSSVTVNTSNLPDGAYFTIATRITGPGCVNPNVLTWLRADYGATGGADWIDFSGNNNTVKQPTAANRANLVAAGINFNPAYNFSGNQWFNIPNIYSTTDSITAFFISRSDNVTIPWQTLAEFGEDRPGLYWNVGGPNEWVQTAVPTGAAHAKKFSTANAALFSFLLPNSNPKTYRVGANGLMQSFAGSTGAFTVGAGGPGGVLPRLGGLVTDNSQDHFDGYISEVVFYRGVVHDTSLPKIHSYLALKYGISLDQTTPTDYVATDGTRMWTAADNTGYNRRITGIGRDDCTNLYQKQSRSMDTGHVTLALGDIIHPTNVENLNTIDNNNSYFVIADNNADTLFNTEISGIEDVTIRMLRTWKVDKTNWVDADVSIQLRGGTPKVYLIVSSDETFGAGDATYQLNDSGLVTIPTADLPDGAYFTFGKQVYGPGYVNNGVSLWLRADQNITSTGPGTAVTNWLDFSGNDVLFQQNAANPLPLFETTNTQFNYNPSLDFVSAGAEQMISLNSGDLIRPATFDNYSMFMAITKDVAANQRPFSMINTGSNGYAMDVNVAGRAGISFEYENGVTIPFNETKLLGVTSDATAANRRGYHNGKLTIDPSTVTLTMSDIVAGTAELGAANGNGAFGGHMGEVIVYNRQVTPDEAQRIQSYLALKYGVTLNQTTPNNYVATNWDGSAGTVYWNATTNAGFNNNIAGIGRDDSTSLLQKQSRSVNTTNNGNMVAIGLGSIAATNAENTNNFTDDLSFMVWGDNGATGVKSGNAATAEVPAALDPNGCSKITRLNREWKVQETGTVGFVQVQFFLNGLVPNIPNSATISDFSLIIDDDGDFSSGTSSVVTPASYNAATKTLTFDDVDFTSGQYFTLVTDLTNEAPGGISTNLYTWYRADKGVTTATGVSVWSDQSTSLEDVAQATVANQPVYNTTTPLINFNPTLSFNGTAHFLANGAISHTAATAGEEIVAVVLPTNATGVQTVVGIGTAANTTNTTELRFNAGRLQYTVNANSLTLASATNGAVQLAAASRSATGTNASLYLNGGLMVGGGTLAGTPALTQLNIGTRRLSAANNLFFNGQVAEVAVYNRQLTQPDREKVFSYLAIKYGITLTHNYTYPDGTVVWDYAVNPTYNFNVTGIGRDDCNGLHQKQSKSINPNGMITIASGSEVSASNAANLNTLENSTALLLADNNGAITPWTATESPAGRNRITREWNVRLTGTVGTVTIQVPASTSAGTVKLPAEINKMYMLVDDDGDFSSGATEVQMTLNGNNWEVSYEFANNTFITFATGNNFLSITSKVNLQGAWDGTAMRTDLKTASLLPATDPYGLNTTPSVSPNTTTAPVVDWIRVELRDAANPATVVTSRAAFVLANGNIVDTGYAQPLAFYGVDPGQYYVVVRHRNHLGAMSEQPVDFASGAASIDFTVNTTFTYGSNAQKDLGSGVMGLWAGNVSGDSSLRHSAKPSDATLVANAVLNHSGNTTASPGYTGFINVYSVFDVNLDGRVYYTATPSDHAIIVDNVKSHPANAFALTSFIIWQQLP